MQKLVEGIHQFQNDVFSSKQRLFEGLVDGQQPLALFICADGLVVVACFYLIIGAVDVVRVRRLKSCSQRRERSEDMRSIQAIEAEVTGESS